MNNKRLAVILWSFFLLAPATGFAAEPPSEPEARQLITLRKLGHLLLLSSKDSTSRIMPVVQQRKGEYLISFEKPFGFIPDSLVRIATDMKTQNLLSGSFTLSVYEQGNHQLVYGFTSEELEKGIAPCIDRAMPAARYHIRIQFSSGILNAGALPLPVIPSVFSALLVAGGIVGFGFYRRRANDKKSGNGTEKYDSPSQGVKIGAYRYQPDSRELVFNKERVELTDKEQTLLNIFLKHPNQVIDRNLLLKLGWEDEGVVTGRSLDVYVSKLRKRFASDPSVSFRNVHGKGYSLDV